MAALNDIVEKARSFTAATVPSSRTADGSDFYNSFFIPSGDHAFWEGHLRSWKFSAAGEILDRDGHCALDDPDGGSECNNGPFQEDLPDRRDLAGLREPVLGRRRRDQARARPGRYNSDTDARQLYTSKLDASTPPVPVRTDLDQNLTAADMKISTFTSMRRRTPAPNSAQYALAQRQRRGQRGRARGRGRGLRARLLLRDGRDRHATSRR